MIPFRLSFRSGALLYKQVVYAAKRAMIAGTMRPGEPFPSVRTLSRELKINPNTAHKVIAQLVSEGMLEIRVGVGAVVAARTAATAGERSKLLKGRLEELVVEAKRLGLEINDVVEVLMQHWRRLDQGKLMRCKSAVPAGVQ